MRLAERRSTHNFYESFSDLIFCALVLFVVLVLYLVLNVNEKVLVFREQQQSHRAAVASFQNQQQDHDSMRAALEAQLRDQADALKAQERQLKYERREVNAQEREVDRMMGVNRFSGQQEETLWAMVLQAEHCVNYDCEYDFIPIPRHAQDRYTIKHGRESDARQFAEAFDLTREVLASCEIFSWEEIEAVLRAMQRRPQRSEVRTGQVSTVTSFEANVVASRWVDRSRSNRIGGLTRHIRDMESFFLDVYSRWVDETPSDHPGPPTSIPVLHFDVDDTAREVVLSGMNFSPAKMVQLLRSFSGGGIIVEFDPPLEEAGSTTMPDWVTQRILIPSGYHSRAPDTSRYSLST